MIAEVPNLDLSERRAVAELLRRALDSGEPPLIRAFLFGSKARGDDRHDSDVDVLALCAIDPDDRDQAAAALGEHAEAVYAATGIAVEPWVVPECDLEVGGRTPMLVDALDDGIPIWPRGASPLHIDFTPADAAFCASCLLDWVDEGGSIVRRALGEGRWEDAALRARDDITRMATAALLLDGDTRHRRRGSIVRFRERWVRTGRISRRALPALEWAARAFPPDGLHRTRPIPVTPSATATAPLGFELAGLLEEMVVPLLFERIAKTEDPWATSGTLQ